MASHRGRVSVIADEAAQDSSVLLLNPGLVVLAVRSEASELDPSFVAPMYQRLVDEGTVVVRIDPKNRERQLPDNGLQVLDHQGLLAGQQRNGFGPTGADVGCHQVVDEGPR